MAQKKHTGWERKRVRTTHKKFAKHAAQAAAAASPAPAADAAANKS